MRFPDVSAAVLVCLLGAPVSAQVPLPGNFLASKSCAALQSIRKNSNPGNAALEAGQSYKLLGKNKEQASHYWVEVPGAVPPRRWVAVDCGEASAPIAEFKPSYLLALSWQPAFCESHPGKAECMAETPASFDATHLSLHGLWPQPRRVAYCNVSPEQIAADDAHRWESLPEPDLTPETKAGLDQAMPGTRSLLERHEWIKHGTCYPGGVAETYFADAIRVTSAFNDSPVQGFLAANIGKTVSGKELRAKFNEGFGKGAGDRVRLACKDDGGRRLIVEITVGLRGNITIGTAVSELIAAAPPTDAGCPAGVIDPAGLQ